MRRPLSALLLFLFYLTPLAAQESVEIFGYFESQFTGAEVQNEFYQLYTNKLRVDLKSQVTDNITFAANFDYITFHGKTNWNILDFLASDVVSGVPEGMESFYVLDFSDRHFLDNAYLKMAFKHFDLTVGKQQISLGTGYVWNPTDVFNIKDVLDPTYEQPGHNAMRIDVSLGSEYTLTALLSPEDTWRHTAKLIQFKGNVSRFDYSLIFIEKVWRFHDYTQFDFENMNFLEAPEMRQVFGGSLVGELLGMGVWAEYGYNRMETTKDFHELVVGGDYTFDFQTYVMAEYYRNTLGKTDYREYNLNDWMRMMATEQKAISRDQVYVLAQHPATDLLNVGLSSVFSISDGSLALIPTLSYSLSDNVDVFAYLNLNFGKEGKAFGKNMGNGGLVRIRVYF